MYKTIVALLLLAAVANAQLVGWRNCGSSMATIHRVRIGGCSQTPCDFVIGSTYRLEVDATSSIFLGQQIPLIQGNACQHFLVGECPARTGNDFTFSNDYQVTDILPAISTVVTSTMWNDFGDVGVCIQVDMNVRPRPDSD